MTLTDNLTGGSQQVALSGSGPTFTMAASPTTLTVASPGGTSAPITLSLTPQAKFAQGVTLTCAGLPAGASCLFTANPVQMTGGGVTQAKMEVRTTTSTPTGTYPITLTGTYANLSDPVALTLNVN